MNIFFEVAACRNMLKVCPKAIPVENRCSRETELKAKALGKKLAVVQLAAAHKRSFERDNALVSEGLPCALSLSCSYFLICTFYK